MAETPVYLLDASSGVLVDGRAQSADYVLDASSGCIIDGRAQTPDTSTASAVIDGRAQTPTFAVASLSGRAQSPRFVLSASQFFAGYMTQTSRTGCGVPFPEYANLTAGSGYVTPPEPDLAMQLFELTIVGSGVVAVTWCDERHIGTHDVPATGTGTLIGGVFDSTLTYGAYSVHIQGTVAAGAFTGTVTTTVTGVTEVHAITVESQDV